jgi:hypothetical protein
MSTAQSKSVRGVEEAATPFLSAPRDTFAGRAATAAMDDARAMGLLDGGDKDHVSVRVPRALLTEARRQTGIESATDLMTAALALAAQSDPVAEFMEKNRGIFGKDFQLEY